MATEPKLICCSERFIRIWRNVFPCDEKLTYFIPVAGGADDLEIFYRDIERVRVGDVYPCFEENLIWAQRYRVDVSMDKRSFKYLDVQDRTLR